MLFQDHKDNYKIVEGEVVLFTGTFVVNVQDRTLGFIVGIKQKDGLVRATVTYHNERALPQVKLDKTMSPAEFEKLLNSTAMKLATKPNYKLVEFSFRTRLLDDPFTAFLEDEEKDALLQLFLLRTLNGVDRAEAYNIVTHAIKDIVKQRI